MTRRTSVADSATLREANHRIVEEYSATCYDTYGPRPLLIGAGDTQHNGPGRKWRFIRPVTILPFRK